MPITHPLQQYRQEYKARFREIAEQTFDALVGESGVDAEANKALCAEIHSLQDDESEVRRRLTRTTMLCATLWTAIAGVACYLVFWRQDTQTAIALGATAAVCLILLLAKVHPAIKRQRADCDELQSRIEAKTDEAWRQMEGLNRLYDWDTHYRMFTQTVPCIEYDDFVPTARVAQLDRHGMRTDLGDDTSVLYAHSGTINGNPFALLRTRTMQWGTMTYTGTKTIHWTTRERGADGKYETRHHSETLTATIVEPYPEYPEMTQLVYGHSAAPRLTFHREKNTFRYKAGGLMYALKKKRLERRSRKLSADFAMGTNDEFEVMFTTTDRSDNQQYFLLFTPAAQHSMVELIKDTDDAYGDDFQFVKSGEVNYVISDHVQSMELDLDPRNFRHYDLTEARSRFISLNCDYFRALYFCLAPLLSIPLYQEAPEGYMTQPTRRGEARSAEWEHESLANHWGDAEFRHPSCETACILKTATDGQGTLQVTAAGYASHPRVTYVRKYGGDGRWHSVPVHWREYYPVTGTGTLSMREYTPHTPELTHTERRHARTAFLRTLRRGVFRRSIWSAR